MDQLGSVRDLLDSSGVVQKHWYYNSFGKQAETTSSTVKEFFAYTGREADEETGLYYYRARYYDQLTGRFLSEDPIGFSAGDNNLYRYVHNDPVNAKDPRGLAADSDFESWKKTWQAQGFWTVPVLNQPTIDRCKQWYELKLQVYHSDYFNEDVGAILTRVAHFYAKYGVYVNWYYQKVPTPPTYIYPEPPYLNLPPIGAYREAHPYEHYFNDLDVNTDLAGGHAVPEDIGKEPEIKWYWDHFPHVPSIFFIGDIDLPGLVPGPDAFGLTYADTFTWIPPVSGAPKEEFTVTHELGHVLGLGHDPFEISVMRSSGLAFLELEKYSFHASEVTDMLRSKWLKKIPAPAAAG